jgi:CRP/FNR family nitrogen fixation transcriptional regulator
MDLRRGSTSNVEESAIMLTEPTCENRPSGYFARPTARRTAANGSFGSLERAGAPLSFARDAAIYEENDPADCIYRVVSGAVRTCRTLVDGRRQIGAFYVPGEIFGLASGERHAFSAEAVTGTKVQVICRHPKVVLQPSDNELSAQMWALMAGELKRSNDHVYLLIKTAPERVASFLLEFARRIQSPDEVELPMSRRDIADYLGLTIETVSRMLTQLEKTSAIALPTSRRIVLRDRAVLKRLVA